MVGNEVIINLYGVFEFQLKTRVPFSVETQDYLLGYMVITLFSLFTLFIYY